MPGLVKLRKENKKLEVIGWHVGKGTEKDVAGLVKSKGIPYPVVMTAGFDEVKNWGAGGIPRIAVIDRKGRVRATDQKPADGEALAARLLKE